MNYTAMTPFTCIDCRGLALRPVIPPGVIAIPATLCPSCDKKRVQALAKDRRMEMRLQAKYGNYILDLYHQNAE